MRAEKIDIDRLAREASRVQEAPRDLTAEEVDFTPAYWNILVAPIKPRSESSGGIQIAAVTQNTEKYLITIGRVLKCGPSAFEGTTESGIRLSQLCKGIETPEQLVGKYVIYQPHAGIELKRRADDRVVKIITNTEILGITDDPFAWRFWI